MAALFLASASPRRRELLTQIGVPFSLITASIDETPHSAESAEQYVQRLAREKALAGLTLAGDGACVLGADTTVVLQGKILGKPADRGDGLAMLAALSASEHEVMTAIALADRDLSLIHI